MSDSRAELLQRFTAAWRQRPTKPEARPLLLLSGGSDSVALLRLLVETDRPVRCLHFVHRSESEFSQASEAFCRELCAELGVPLQVRTLDIPDQMAQGDLSWQAAARSLRYRGSLSPSRLTLTAHTLDDQAETVLLGLLTGRGPSGLGGIHPVREDGLFRPLLGFQRAELQRYLQELEQPWLSDPSNRDGNLRARVRHRLLPLVCELEPMAMERLARFSELLRADEAYLQAETVAALQRSRQDKDCWTIATLAELDPPIRYRVLRALWRSVVPPTRRPLASLLEQTDRLLLEGGDDRGVDFPGGGGVRRLGSRLWLRPAGLPEPLDLKLDGLLAAPLPPYLELAFRRPESDGQTLLLGLPPSDQRAAFRVRTRRPGDRFDIYRVKKLLAERGTPPWVRERTPLLLHGDRIVAVPGTPYRCPGSDAQLALIFRPDRLRAEGPV